MLEEWAEVQDFVTTGHAFHTKIMSDLISVKDWLHEGLPCWPRKTSDILFNPLYGKEARAGERFETFSHCSV